MVNGVKHKEVRRGFGSLGYMITFLLLAVVLIAWDKPATALATTTGTMVNVTVDYTTETATVSAGPGNSTKFYISIDKQKTWEDINPVTGLVDITALLSTKSVDVYFKGNKDTAVKTVTLMEEPNNVKAVYEIKDGKGVITYSVSGAAIEYRKGPNGNWKTPPAVFDTYMYELKGATIQFRSAANTITRAGKIITVKIPKRPAPPALKVDGSKQVITGIKANDTQFLNADGFWQYVTTDSKTKTVSLYTLSNTSPNPTAKMPEKVYEFRSYTANKKVISGTRLIEVPVQPDCPETIKLEGINLTITDSSNRAYEYSILSSRDNFDTAVMKWTSITANKTLAIKKAYPSDRIFVRLKSTTDKSKVVTPASTCKMFTVQ